MTQIEEKALDSNGTKKSYKLYGVKVTALMPTTGVMA